ncbi:unnamed protein product [Phyllotreta striolata]|uniref:Nitrilase and fragile histidine triad fusion protein NitFhit n=1 Tax=Phyllotreta striolata TaxID=444603 RepID=A0A9N9TFY7_PHYSR|nr:unnamed protein product [Phyllotreta striolata]
MSSNNLLRKCKVAVCQFTATNNKSHNFSVVKRLIERAKNENAQMAFLPEACDYIASNKAEVTQLAEEIDGPLVTEYKAIAKTNRMWLSIGGFHERCNENTVYNSHLLIDDSGTIKSIYRKIHLFDVELPEQRISLKESDTCKAGSELLAPIETPAGMLGQAVCYDLRFPELSLLQTRLGADILTFPSAFTATTGAAHWETLLRARAIENQCYVIAAAQYGQHNNKRTSYGQSLVIDPWGNVRAECPKYTEGIATDESVAVAEIDVDYSDKIRREMPVRRHRRNDIYELNLVPSTVEEIGECNYSFADKVIPSSTVFYRSKHSFAFTNIRCVVPGHVLVAPLRLAPRLQDLTKEEVADLFQTAVRAQKAVEQEYGADSSNLCVQDGESAGRTVPHVHVHILPRKAGDFQNNDDVYMELAKHDRGNNAKPIRLLQEMSDEAGRLKTFFNL